MRLTNLSVAFAILVGCAPGNGLDGGGPGGASSTESMSSGNASSTGQLGATTGSSNPTGATSGLTTGSESNTAASSGGAGSSTTSAAGGAGTTATSSATSATSTTTSTGSAMMPPAEVFGQTGSTLYKLDPDTLAVTTVGNFVFCDSDVFDIAINKSGQMYGTTDGAVYKIDKTTAVCTFLAAGSYPNSLSFVPAGTVDPNVEALVGYVEADYVRIDLSSGLVSSIGSLGNAGYISSGDVVSVIGGGTYLTVKDGPQNCSDCIVEVNPATGALTNFIGALGHNDVYGLAFWGGVAYGFDDTGHIFQIDLSNASSTNVPIPGSPNLVWYGAGSTTAARLTN